ncbi:hypothetical protein [Rothia dentocariosa]|nr:hypothetical protein [Rothia dentocariosa]
MNKKLEIPLYFTNKALFVHHPTAKKFSAHTTYAGCAHPLD